MNILEFYDENRSELEHVSFLDSEFENDPAVRKRLEQAKNLPALKKLCGGDREVMFVVLQVFISLPMAKDLDSHIVTRNRRLKNEPVKAKAHFDKLVADCARAVSNVKLVDPEFDEKRFLKIASKWMNRKINMKIIGRDEMDHAIDYVCMIDRRLDANRLRKQAKQKMLEQRISPELKSKILKRFGINDPSKNTDDVLRFNTQLLRVFKLCKQKTNKKDNAVYDRMADVLNSLHITTKTGLAFTKGGLKKLLKKTA